jgi:hypothetical protein
LIAVVRSSKYVAQKGRKERQQNRERNIEQKDKILIVSTRRRI